MTGDLWDILEIKTKETRSYIYILIKESLGLANTHFKTKEERKNAGKNRRVVEKRKTCKNFFESNQKKRWFKLSKCTHTYMYWIDW